MKVAWVSNVLPPSSSAHAAILHRLLRDRATDTYCLLSGRNYERRSPDDVGERLPGAYYHLRNWRITRGYRFGMARIRETANLLLDSQRAFSIAGILRRENCGAIVAVTGGDEIQDFAAAYVASRLRGIPFYAYLLDQFSHMVRFAMGMTLLRYLEPRMMRNAAAVIVPNEFLAEDVRTDYGVSPVVIHNPCDLGVYENNRSDRAAGEPWRIVYTGHIGVLHFAAFRNLATALGRLNGGEATLHLYAKIDDGRLTDNGIVGPIVAHGVRPLAEMPSIQQSADILFLPLSVTSPHPEIVRTAAPGKMGEFLAARRPILVHAPPDSFLAWYFRRHECGLVVDRDDPEELARALRRLMAEPDLRRRLSERAWERAQADFDLTQARARFDALLGW